MQPRSQQKMKGAKRPMKYILMMNGTKANFSQYAKWSKKDMEANVAFMHFFNKQLKDEGVFVAAEGLGWPDQAKLVRAAKDGTPITDGVFPSLLGPDFPQPDFGGLQDFAGCVNESCSATRSDYFNADAESKPGLLLSRLITAEGRFVDFFILHYDKEIVGLVFDQLDNRFPTRANKNPGKRL
jgi:hypothetical protein